VPHDLDWSASKKRRKAPHIPSLPKFSLWPLLASYQDLHSFQLKKRHGFSINRQTGYVSASLTYEHFDAT
jgi:hypothetical protein